MHITIFNEFVKIEKICIFSITSRFFLITIKAINIENCLQWHLHSEIFALLKLMKLYLTERHSKIFLFYKRVDLELIISV